MKKRNWFIIASYHERYSLETTVTYCPDMTIEEVIDMELRISREHIKEREYDHFYEADLSCRQKLEKEKHGYSYPDIKDMTGLAHIHLDSVMIVSETYLKDEGVASQCWGYSDSKFGLLDYNRESEVDD